MRPFRKSAITTALLASSFLAACSDGGTVTTLDAQPAVSVSVPTELQNDSSVVQANLSPQIRLSNGAAVNLTRNADGTWAGTISVAPGRTYIATIVWVETIDGQDIPLASQTQTLEVTADGNVIRTDSNGYSTDIDSDSDGNSNLAERRNGTRPLQADSSSGKATRNEEPTDTAPATPSDPVTAATPLTVNPVTEATLVTVNPTAITTPVTTPITTPVTTPDTIPDMITDTVPDTASDTIPAVIPDPLTDPTVADVIVPRVASGSAPLIDGDGVGTLGTNGELLGEWAAAVQLDNSGTPLLIDKLQLNADSDEIAGSPGHLWAAMHDGVYLYVLVLVDDAGDRLRDSGSTTSDSDSVEIFLDGDNSKSLRYDANDRSQLFPLQLAGDDAQSTSDGDVGSDSSSARPLSARFATGPGKGPASLDTPAQSRDVYEIRIALASAGINIDKPLGFEIIVNDDDGSGESNSQWSWKLPTGSTGNLHQNPSLFGTVILE